MQYIKTKLQFSRFNIAMNNHDLILHHVVERKENKNLKIIIKIRRTSLFLLKLYKSVL